MYLEISTTYRPATDLGYLLHKNPANYHNIALNFGAAHVFYPVADDDKCTAVLLVDVDPVALVRGRTGSETGGLLTQYVNDRPYAVSSFMSVAIARAFGTAIAGNCKQRPELVTTPIPLEVRILPVPRAGDAELIERLFAPLGYEVTLSETTGATAADPDAPSYGALTLRADCTLAALLRHLYVLIPVLDNDKHYWIGSDEVDKLVNRGEGWLSAHPEKDVIVRRYLKHRPRLANEALARLTEDTDPDPEESQQAKTEEEQALEAPLRLNDIRLATVVGELRAAGARRVLDLGCSTGRLVRELIRDRQFEEIVGVDVSLRALEVAERRLRLDQLTSSRRERIKLLHGALTYRDARLEGYDAAAVVEVIEHLDLPRLDAFERVLFACSRPKTIVVTTPNVEFNATFPDLPAGKLRHRDHRFEWTRREFKDWAAGVARRHSYDVRFGGIGEDHPTHGPPTQYGVFTR